MNSDLKVLKKKVNISKLRDWYEELEKSYKELKLKSFSSEMDGSHYLTRSKLGKHF